MLFRRLLDAWSLPEATLQEIQARHRIAPPVTAWEPCPHCKTLVRGAHRCPVVYRERSEAVIQFRTLLLAIELRRRERTSRSKKVLTMTRRRTAA